MMYVCLCFEHALVSKILKTCTKDLIQKEDDIAHSYLFDCETCKHSELANSHDESSHSKVIPQVSYHVCKKLQEPTFIAKSMVLDFENLGQEEDAIITIFFNLVVMHMSWMMWVAFW